jgi:hypothetical protein
VALTLRELRTVLVNRLRGEDIELNREKIKEVIMRKGKVFSRPAYLVVAATLAFATPFGVADDDHDNGKGINSFAKCVAGSYLVNAATGPLPPMMVLITYHADGTFRAEGTADFGHGSPVAFRSGRFGNWVQTGKRELAITRLFFDYDEAGILVSIGRTSALVTFDLHCQEYSGTGIVQVFAPDQDPLDPDEEPAIIELPIATNGWRIPVMTE